MTDVESIATNPELVKELELKLPYKNLSALVSKVQELNRPGGSIQGIYKDKILDKLIIKNKLIEVDSNRVKTTFSDEALQDLSNIYGENIYKILGEFLSEEVNEELNTKLLDFLDLHSTLGTNLVFNPADLKSTADVIFNIKTKISVEIVRLAKVNKMPVRGFAIVSSGIATAMLVDGYKSISNRENGVTLDNLYLGTIGAVDYYLNPFHVEEVDKVYVGLNSVGNKGGSLYYLPYSNTVTRALNSDSGTTNLFLINRSSISLNPFDESTGNNDSKYLSSFTIDISSFNY